MFFIGKEFIKPTKKLRILSLLQALSENSRLSQSKLGKFSHTSSAMVHQYLADLQKQGQIDFQPVDGKSYMYSLTSKGMASRRAFMDAYCTEMVQAYAAIKQLVRDKLEVLNENTIGTVALFGAAETCELVLSALEDTPYEVAGIFDNAQHKQGTLFHDHRILPPDALADLDADAVIITSFAKQDEIFRQLNAMPGLANRKIIKL